MSQIPGTILTAPQADAQQVQVVSPLVGEWEVGLMPRGDGGTFRLSANLRRAGSRGEPKALDGTIQPGQRLSTRIQVHPDGSVEFVGDLHETLRSRAKIAPAPIGNTTTSPLPQARLFTTGSPPSSTPRYC